MTFLEEEKNGRLVKEIEELFNRDQILDALVFHYKKSEQEFCTTTFHVELDDGFARITVTDKELNNVIVEILSQDDWLDSIEKSKKTANIGKWIET